MAHVSCKFFVVETESAMEFENRNTESDTQREREGSHVTKVFAPPKTEK